MSKVVIPVQATLTRVDGTSMQASELASLNAFMSLDGGQNFTALPALTPDATSITIDGVDPGSDVIVDVSETDKQVPPATSIRARVAFSIPLPRLADPSAPALGTPVIS